MQQQRKGWDVLLRGFLAEFSPKENVSLTIKVLGCVLLVRLCSSVQASSFSAGGFDINAIIEDATGAFDELCKQLPRGQCEGAYGDKPHLDPEGWLLVPGQPPHVHILHCKLSDVQIASLYK